MNPNMLVKKLHEVGPEDRNLLVSINGRLHAVHKVTALVGGDYLLELRTWGGSIGVFNFPAETTVVLTDRQTWAMFDSVGNSLS